MMIEINAQLVFEFQSKQHWIDKAKEKIGHYRNQGVTLICVDRMGNQCQIGEDFRLAQENDLYPVKEYTLVRTKHYLMFVGFAGQIEPENYHKSVAEWVEKMERDQQP